MPESKSEICSFAVDYKRQRQTMKQTPLTITRAVILLFKQTDIGAGTSKTQKQEKNTFNWSQKFFKIGNFLQELLTLSQSW